MLSNVSESPITVKISFYDQDGQLLAGDDNNPSSGGIQLREAQANYAEASCLDCTVSFDLEPRESEKVSVIPDLFFAPQTLATEFGFIKITWTSANDLVNTALVATFQQHRLYSGSSASLIAMPFLPVNNGLPF